MSRRPHDEWSQEKATDGAEATAAAAIIQRVWRRKARRSVRPRCLWPSLSRLKEMYLDEVALAAGADEGEYYTDEMIVSREQLRSSHLVVEALRVAWERIAPICGGGAMDFAGYGAMIRRCYLLFKAQRREAYIDAQEFADEMERDWARDAGGQDGMEQTELERCWFELADLHVDGVSAAEYASFITDAIAHITTPNGTWQAESELLKLVKRRAGRKLTAAAYAEVVSKWAVRFELSADEVEAALAVDGHADHAGSGGSGGGSGGGGGGGGGSRTCSRHASRPGSQSEHSRLDSRPSSGTGSRRGCGHDGWDPKVNFARYLRSGDGPPPRIDAAAPSAAPAVADPLQSTIVGVRRLRSRGPSSDDLMSLRALPMPSMVREGLLRSATPPLQPAPPSQPHRFEPALDTIPPSPLVEREIVISPLRCRGGADGVEDHVHTRPNHAPNLDVILRGGADDATHENGGDVEAVDEGCTNPQVGADEPRVTIGRHQYDVLEATLSGLIEPSGPQRLPSPRAANEQLRPQPVPLPSASASVVAVEHAAASPSRSKSLVQEKAQHKIDQLLKQRAEAMAEAEAVRAMTNERHRPPSPPRSASPLIHIHMDMRAPSQLIQPASVSVGALAVDLRLPTAPLPYGHDLSLQPSSLHPPPGIFSNAIHRLEEPPLTQDVASTWPSSAPPMRASTAPPRSRRRSSAAAPHASVPIQFASGVLRSALRPGPRTTQGSIIAAGRPRIRRASPTELASDRVELSASLPLDAPLPRAVNPSNAAPGNYAEMVELVGELRRTMLAEPPPTMAPTSGWVHRPLPIDAAPPAPSGGAHFIPSVGPARLGRAATEAPMLWAAEVGISEPPPPPGAAPSQVIPATEIAIVGAMPPGPLLGPNGPPGVGGAAPRWRPGGESRPSSERPSSRPSRASSRPSSAVHGQPPAAAPSLLIHPSAEDVLSGLPSPLSRPRSAVPPAPPPPTRPATASARESGAVAGGGHARPLPVISGEGEGTIIFKSGGLDSRLGRVTRPRVPTAPAASAIDRALVKSFGANLGKQSTGGHVIAFQAYTLEPLGQPKASALPLCPTAASKAVSRAVTKVLAERPSPEPLDWTADPARPEEHSKTGRRVPPAEFTSEVPLATIHSIMGAMAKDSTLMGAMNDPTLHPPTHPLCGAPSPTRPQTAGSPRSSPGTRAHSPRAAFTAPPEPITMIGVSQFQGIHKRAEARHAAVAPWHARGPA